jgi:polyphosphate kinase 2 (PPK2 family)
MPESSQDDYDRDLETLQGRLALLVRRRRFRKHALVLAFEGMDAAGKGGAIRRVTHALDARQYQVVPVSAPTPEELSYPYLWRFWRHVPELGRIAIFDRTWYGRVLVERVRGFAAAADWQRAYDEIREFELQLTERNIVVAKFWLQVGKAEQLRRFEERDSDPLKRFKVDAEDWVNRRFYGDYQRAAAEAIRRTDAPAARWSIIDADDKKRARLYVLQVICATLERSLEGG